MATPAARPCRPRLTAAQGPRKSRRASCAPEAPGLRALASARRSALLFGAPMARRAGGGKSAGWLAGMRASFSSGQESRRKTPPPARAPGRQSLSRTRSGNAWRARHRGVVFSWLLLFWTSKREVARAPAGARNRFVVCEEARAKAPLPHPSPASGRGAIEAVASTRPSPQPSPRRGEGVNVGMALMCRSSRPGSPAAASTRPPARTA